MHVFGGQCRTASADKRPAQPPPARHLMKFQPDKFDAPGINGYGPDWVIINGERHEDSLLLSATGAQAPWDCRQFDELTPAHFERILTLDADRPEVVIFGSGQTHRFPKPQWLAPLVAARVGLESMDMPAACRTYNILASEGRKVVLALLIER